MAGGGFETSTERSAAPGVSDTYAQELMEQVFAEQLQGHPLLVNNSKWANFLHVSNRSWSHRNLVLLGDAAHTAHFSVGSGTKMAMEDAIGLAAELASRGAKDPVEGALCRYEARRRPETERTQRWALPSMRWWETFGSRMDRDPDRFGFHFLTRTSAIGLAGLRRRHPERIAAAEEAYAHDAPRTATAVPGGHALGAPLRLGGALLRNRLVTVVADRAERQIRACEAYSVAGSSLVLADWRRPVGAGESDAWRAALERVSFDATVLGVVLRALDTAAADRAEAVGFPVVEVVLDDIGRCDEAEAAEHGLLERKFLGSLPAGAALIAGLGCPGTGAYENDALVERALGAAEAGACALHLRAPDGTGLAHALEHADRIRTATGLPVVLACTDGWALETPADRAEGEHALLHTALVAGRDRRRLRPAAHRARPLTAAPRLSPSTRTALLSTRTAHPPSTAKSCPHGGAREHPDRRSPRHPVRFRAHRHHRDGLPVRRRRRLPRDVLAAADARHGRDPEVPAERWARLRGRVAAERGRPAPHHPPRRVPRRHRGVRRRVLRHHPARGRS